MEMGIKEINYEEEYKKLQKRLNWYMLGFIALIIAMGLLYYKDMNAIKNSAVEFIKENCICRFTYG